MSRGGGGRRAEGAACVEEGEKAEEEASRRAAQATGYKLFGVAGWALLQWAAPSEAHLGQALFLLLLVLEVYK